MHIDYCHNLILIPSLLSFCSSRVLNTLFAIQFSFLCHLEWLIRICNKRTHNTVEYDKLQVMHLDNLHAQEYNVCWSKALGTICTTGYRNCVLFTM